VRGVLGNWHPYRDHMPSFHKVLNTATRKLDQCGLRVGALGLRYLMSSTLWVYFLLLRYMDNAR